jgi:hypothetical protein
MDLNDNGAFEEYWNSLISACDRHILQSRHDLQEGRILYHRLDLGIQQAQLYVTGFPNRFGDWFGILRAQEMFATISNNLSVSSSVNLNNEIPRWFTWTDQSTGGRPKKHVDVEFVYALRAEFWKWEDICKFVGVSNRWLRGYLKSVDFVDPGNFTDICDADLDLWIRTIKEQFPHIGRTYLMGALRANGLRVSYARLRNAIYRVDPTGSANRWASTVRRRVYNVVGSNALWHMDGNHKLINWKFVVHGIIDGDSRMITALRCTTNNLATTVKVLFDNAVYAHGWPLRVRADAGVENVLVARCMRELDPRRYIVGRSVHNQRIDRLWREVNRVVLSTFAELFMRMEEGVVEF